MATIDIKDDFINKNHALSTKKTIIGNNCGHDVKNMRKYNLSSVTIGSKSLPTPILHFINSLNNCYNNNKYFLKSLFSNESSRIRRSELRESAYLVLSHFMRWCDLSSFHALKSKGLSTYKEFTVGSLARELKIGVRRTQRVIAELRKSKLINSIETKLGWRNSKTRFILTNNVFRDIGILKTDLIRSVKNKENSIIKNSNKKTNVLKYSDIPDKIGKLLKSSIYKSKNTEDQKEKNIKTENEMTLNEFTQVRGVIDKAHYLKSSASYADLEIKQIIQLIKDGKVI